MQEQFDSENMENLLPEDEQSVFEAALAERERQAKAKKKLRFAATHVGWATTLLIAVWMAALVFVSVLAGLAGMLLSSSAFRIIDARLTDWEPMNRFKVYFTFALILLGMLSFLIWRLPEKKTKTNK